MHKQDREPEQFIRLLIDPGGNIQLSLDIPRDGDIRVEHQGDTIIVTEPAICIVLADVIVDVQDSGNGLVFTVRKRRDLE